MKVIYVNYDVRTDKPQYGETDGKIIDGEFLRVDGKLVNIGAVWEDTPENRMRLAQFQDEYREWKNLEPNVYDLINKLKRVAALFR